MNQRDFFAEIAKEFRRQHRIKVTIKKEYDFSLPFISVGPEITGKFRIPANAIEPIQILWNESTAAYERDRILGLIANAAPYITAWHNIQNAWMRTPEYKERRKRDEFFALAQRAGLENDEHGGYKRGDYFTLYVTDFTWKQSELRAYHASGNLLGLVSHERKRVYAKSSKWYPKTRIDHYVVGTNENGVPFAHAVPNTINTLDKAVRWIWNNNTVLARHGDVAVCKCNLKHVTGETKKVRVIDSHILTGEIYRNGSLYARNAVLRHEKGQHPDVIIGPEWRKIVIARRSKAAESTVD